MNIHAKVLDCAAKHASRLDAFIDKNAFFECEAMNCKSSFVYKGSFKKHVLARHKTSDFDCSPTSLAFFETGKENDGSKKQKVGSFLLNKSIYYYIFIIKPPSCWYWRPLG